MTSHSTIRIDDDFATSNAGIALRTADDKTAGGIDQVCRLLIQPFRGHYFLDEECEQSLAYFLLFHVRGVLRPHNHRRDAHATASARFTRNLRLRAVPHPPNVTRAAPPGQPTAHF